MLSATQRDAYLSECRTAAVRYIADRLGERAGTHPAYRAVLDYPLREAKGIRPAIAIATCRALGGGFAEILPTAAAFELLHNAFLVHDDIEDGSELRRHAPTLARQLGIPLAVHAGDTMLSLALEPLLDNMQLLDLGRALRLLRLISAIMRKTAEGQALELTWIAEQRWDITPDEYVEMVTHKTAWYTFAGPIAAGAIVAEAPATLVDELTRFAIDLGVAFQIRDDILNLEAEPSGIDERSEVAGGGDPDGFAGGAGGLPRGIGKEAWGDLWEGKRTLILALFFARAAPADAIFARGVLRKPRPSSASDPIDTTQLDRAMDLVGDRLAPDSRETLRAAFRDIGAATFKRADEIAKLRKLIDPEIARAAHIAAEFASRASERWASIHPAMAPSIHRDLIESILEFTITRDR